MKEEEGNEEDGGNGKGNVEDGGTDEEGYHYDIEGGFITPNLAGNRLQGGLIIYVYTFVKLSAIVTPPQRIKSIYNWDKK